MLFFYSIRGCELIKERDWDSFGDLLFCSSFWEEEGSQGLSLNLATEEMILHVDCPYVEDGKVALSCEM